MKPVCTVLMLIVHRTHGPAAVANVCNAVGTLSMIVAMTALLVFPLSSSCLPL